MLKFLSICRNRFYFVLPARLEPATFSFVARHSNPTELWEHIFAEAEGFEPPDPFGPTVFKTAALDHSAILPIFDCKGTIAGCSLFAQPKII